MHKNALFLMKTDLLASSSWVAPPSGPCQPPNEKSWLRHWYSLFPCVRAELILTSLQAGYKMIATVCNTTSCVKTMVWS